MGDRGPAPLPTAIKKLRGTARKDRENPAEPQPEVGRPACPKWLDGEAKAEWRRVVPLLLELRVLSKQDRAMLAVYCQAWSRWRAAEGVIAREGLTFVTESGFIAKHPAVTIAAESMRIMEKAAQHFGMTPSSRSRVSQTPAPPEKDPAEELLQRKKGA